jgi:hypothetical protein
MATQNKKSIKQVKTILLARSILGIIHFSNELTIIPPMLLDLSQWPPIGSNRNRSLIFYPA